MRKRLLVAAVIDRPLGSAYPRFPDMIYPVNYGYVPGVLGGDGQEQDVYILGPDIPLSIFTGERIAVVRRRNDLEEKWVLVHPGVRLTPAEIAKEIAFQEQYFDSEIIMEDADE